MKTLQA